MPDPLKVSLLRSPPEGMILLGPTASGKTRLAARLAARCGGEIISADSRQVYRGMDLGTGKDLTDYEVAGQTVAFHLIDIRHPGEDYSVFDFQRDALRAFQDIRGRGCLPILCGGTGLYLESVLEGYRLLEVPRDGSLRQRLAGQSDASLVSLLASLRPLHNRTDTRDRERLVRAIEIEWHQQSCPARTAASPTPPLRVAGIRWEREALRQRITARLRQRLEAGMVAEVEALLRQGVPVATLRFYGLEYRFVTRHLEGELTAEEMFRGLNIAIHQFAKRQMTWFRRMERRGTPIHWLEGAAGTEANLEACLELVGRP